MVLAQVGLGIATVLTSPSRVPRDWGQFEWYALLHQFIALLFLLSLVLVLFLSQRKESAKSTGSIEPERVL